ncbi:MAG TPA: hypothetical protein VGL81_12945 [Polyangiaceae bacterium]|jgi:hypothetical protein
MRSLLPLAFVPIAFASGCTCGAKQPPSPGEPTAPIPSAAASGVAHPAGPGAKLDPSVFSAPIAAARASHQDVVAGLVVADGVVRAMGIVDGKPAWATDVFGAVSWAPDAELHAQSTSDGGVAFVWRGPRAGKVGRALVLIGPHGELRGEPTEVGAAFCATADGLAWIDPRTSGPTHVLARRLGDPAGREVLSVSPDRDPALVCGDHAVVVLGDGDDDLTATAFVPGAAPRPRVVAIRDSDFGDDDEREHDAYTLGDDLGLVRVGSSGAVALREVPRDGPPSPWRRLKQNIPPDDDVVAVDGDADATLIAYTHDADDACPGIGSTAESVLLLRVDRKTGAESLLTLAPADCDRSPGPFWIAAAAPGGSTVAWVERATKQAAKAAPIAGVALRTLTAAAPKARRIELLADAVVDAGCDDRACSVAALRRPAGEDGMQREAISVFPYP